MLERRIHVFSNDPTLAPYLAHYLQTRSCNMLEEEGKFYLRSSYFETLPLLPTATARNRYSCGLGAVLELTSPTFDTLPLPMKVVECTNAVLFILNGTLNLKYKNCGGLMRFRSVSPEVVEPGSDYEIRNGQRVYTASKDVKMRVIVAAGERFFRVADKQPPSTKKIWNVARNDGPVARALYHYARYEEVVELRKVVEEIMTDTYVRPATKAGIVHFNDWKKQQWTLPEVGTSKMEEFWALLHNSLLLQDQALHSMPLANISQANIFKASGAAMSLQEGRDIVRTLLIKWVKSKP